MALHHDYDKFGRRTTGSHLGLPLNLLDKLLISNEADRVDAREWTLAASVSDYLRGWMDLDGAGLVEVGDPDDFTRGCVRLTAEGERVARSRLVSDKALEAKAVVERVEASSGYAGNKFFGLI